MFGDRVLQQPMALAVVLALGGAGGLLGCRGGGSSGALPTVPTSASTTATSTTTSTVPPTTVYQPRAPQPSQDQASNHLVAAWKAGDRAAGLTDATPVAVDALFAQPYPAGGVQARGCESAVAGPSHCTYRILADGSLLDLSAMAVTGGWMIATARFRS